MNAPLLAAALIFCGSSLPAFCATVTFTFSGTVSNISDPSGVVDDRIVEGESFSGTLTYDTDEAIVSDCCLWTQYYFDPSSTSNRAELDFGDVQFTLPELQARNFYPSLGAGAAVDFSAGLNSLEGGRLFPGSFFDEFHLGFLPTSSSLVVASDALPEDAGDIDLSSATTEAWLAGFVESGSSYSIGLEVASIDVSFGEVVEPPAPTLDAGDFGATRVFGDVETFDPNKPTVVVTHGLQLGDDYSGGIDVKILDQIGSKLEEEYGADVNILLFTWSNAFADSVVDAAGIPLLYADNTGRDLGLQLRLIFGEDYDQPIHLIGHSYGTAVNASAADYLFSQGFETTHFTALDAPIIDSGASEFLAPVPKSVFADLIKNGTVEYFDNYFGNDRLPFFGFPAVGGSIPGAELEGGYEVDGADHTGVWEAYSNTIGDLECNLISGGFAFSASLGSAGCYGVRPGRSIDISAIEAAATLDALLLEHATFDTAHSTIAISTGSNGYGVFSTTVPLFADTLAFDLLFGVIGDGDWLEVLFDDNLLGAFQGINYGDDFSSIFLNVSEYSGDTGLLTFLLVSNGAEPAGLEVNNIRYIGEVDAHPAPVPVPASFLFLISALGLPLLLAHKPSKISS